MGSYPEWDMAALAETYTLHRYWEAMDKAGFLNELAPVVRAIATRGDLGTSADVIAALPKLEIISCYGVGLDAIDLKTAKARGIHVTYTPNVLHEDVADLALALTLAIARRVPQGDVFVRSGKWATENFPLVTRMHGKRMGLIGMGMIGQAIATRATAFGMTVSYHSRSRRSDLSYSYFDSPVALASQSDFLIAAVTGGAATAKLVNADVLKALGPAGYFINVARGSVADEAALLAALENKTIAGAALDVYLNEPAIDPRFFTLDNVVLQPHHGSGTIETRKMMGQLVRDNLAAHFAGRPLPTPFNIP
jgi:lactate dehydrogenase-like 2-hydroxyacid dehydrogenase